MTRARIMLVLASLLVGIIGGAAHASFTLTSPYSTVVIDPTTGVQDFNLVGTDHLVNEWFWYRIDGSSKETALASLPATTSQPNAGELNVGYTPVAGLNIDINFKLLNSNATKAQLAETIRVTNNMGSSKTISIFEYSHFQVDGTADDTGTVYKSGSLFSTYEQTDPVTGDLMRLSLAHQAERAQVNLFGAPGNVLGKLNDSATTNLSTTLAGTGSPKTGDVEMAFQWVDAVANGSSYEILKSKEIDRQVPEAGSIILFGLGLLGVGLGRRFRRA